MKKNLMKLMMVAVCCLAVVTLAACSGGTPYRADAPITVIGREAGSGTRGAFFNILNNFGDFENDNKVTQRYNDTAAVLNAVKQNGNAIGYDSLGYVTPAVKALKVDGVAATTANILNGTYKLQRDLRVVYAEGAVNASGTDQQKINADFIKFLDSSQAKTIIEAEGYVAKAGETPSYTKTAGLPAAKSSGGDIDISGSTSLKPLMDELVKEYKKLSGFTVIVSGGGSGQGVTDVNNGHSHFGMVSNVTTYAHVHTVAKDGIAVIVNKNNPMENITTNALRDVYFAAGTAIPERNGGTAYTVGAMPENWTALVALMA